MQRFLDDPCPEEGCGNISEVVQRYYLRDSEGGVVYHLRTRCLMGHVLTLSVSREVWAKF